MLIVSKSNPIEVPHRAWLGMAAFILAIWIPGLSFAAAVMLHSAGWEAWGPALALLAAAIGTALQTWNAANSAAERMVRSPASRGSTREGMLRASYVWGLMCVAAWLGLFSHLIG